MIEVNQIKFGILHNHTESSIRDSAMSVKQLFERAKECNAPAVALTDHGILTGIVDFMKASQKYGIKGIPGMEAYFTPADDTNGTVRRHLILMAKDLEGYQAICRANYESYQHIIREKPCMTMEILQDIFGPGSEAHGHVIATSACINGVLAGILLEDKALQKSVEKLERKRDKYHPVDSEVSDAVFQEEMLEQEINRMIEKRDSLTEDSKVNLTGLRRRLKTLHSDDAEYLEVKTKLDEMTQKKEAATAALTEIKRKIAEKKREKSAYSKSIEKMKKSAERWVELNEEIEAILSTGQGEEKLYQKAKDACAEFVDVFGAGNFFIELQYHHIGDEAFAMPKLAQMSVELGVPVVAANDAHYATNSREDIRARTLVAAMRFNQLVEEDEEGFGELYIRDDEELASVLSEILPTDVVNKALENIGAIVEECNVEMTHDNHYPVFVSDDHRESASERLRRLAREGIAKRYPGELWTTDMEHRLEYELNIIDSMGYSDYLCIVQDFLDFGRQLGYDCSEKVGYTIGPGRGSAVGSLVCYLTGITSVDPIRYGLIFERFLNPERVSMPDIDSDFATEIRDKVIEYVRNKYKSKDASTRKNVESICSIITRDTMQAKAAIRNVARVTNIPVSIADEMARQVPTGPHVSIDDIPNLDAQCRENPVIRQLIEDAKLVEGTTINYGVHAAGVIIADNGDVGKYVPLYRNITKNKAVGPWVSQLDKVQCEEDAGMLKMDFLGLNNLDVITDTIRRVKRNYNKSIDVESLPEEPEVFTQIFSSGNTDSVFQFESGGMKDMLRQFQPNSMEDIVLLVAAYRPGPMQYIPDIIKVKHGMLTPHYIADGLEEILKPTYGYPIYQEQVMSIFHKIGGFSLGEADIIRRAMSKKKLSVLTDPETNYQGKFIDGLLAHGASQKEADDFWNQLLDFANYAFNKSHAAAYATISYMTAWLKLHYPAEYMCSVMSRTTYSKIPQLVGNCRKMGLQIAPPDINHSANGFINEGSLIRYGLGNIKGIGNSGNMIIAERIENGPFTSVKDFVTRMLTGSYSAGYDKSVMENLIKCGTFDAFCEGNRSSLLDSIEDFVAITKRLLEKTEILNERTAYLEELNSRKASATEIKKAERSVESVSKIVKATREMYGQHIFVGRHEDRHQKLTDEYELLGIYLSGNPFDSYSNASEKIKNRTAIADASTMADREAVIVCGVIKDLELKQRNRDGMTFAIFNIFDDTGEMSAKCFVAKYAECCKSIVNDGAVTIKGKIFTDKRTTESGEEIEMGRYVNVDSVTPLKRNANKKILASAFSVVDWMNNLDAVKEYQSPSGYELIYTDAVDLTIRSTGLFVTQDILDVKLPGLSFQITTINQK